ncbi:hypothetical protein [Polaribacter gochangensis]|uniref:hypothetical protein n=1 Tax=Polaribacter gochangensis TaxID=3252903 RepID=UPI003904772B
MKKLSALLLLAILFTNCTSVSTEDLTVPTPNSITYTVNVKTIIDQSCATSGCHNATGNSGGLTLETYIQVKNAFENRSALVRMESTSNPMPASGNLPNTSIQIIKNWRDQGYIE